MGRDSCQPLVEGIVEARRLEGNMRKALVFIFAAKTPCFLAFFATLVAGLPFPLSLAKVLLLDLLFVPLLAAGLLREDAEPERPNSWRSSVQRFGFPARQLLHLSCLQFGVTCFVNGLWTYLFIFAGEGFWPLRLIQRERPWEAEGNNEVHDSFGQDWTNRQRESLLAAAQSGFMASIVVGLGAVLLSCRHRWKTGCGGGGRHWMAILICILILLVLFYAPRINYLSTTYIISAPAWVCMLLYPLWLLLFDHCRRMYMYKRPDGIVARETVY